jgi:hypothetical protein
MLYTKVFKTAFILYLIFIPFFSQAQYGPEEVEWDLLKNDHDIAIYKKKHSSGFNTIKIETELRATPKQINRFLLDIDHFPDWIFRCDSTKMISAGQNTHSYLITIQFPFPFLNRYAIIESNHQLNDHELVITSKNLIPKEALPKMVQIPFLSANWTAKTTSSGNVKIIYEMTSDPGGNIPAWLYNLFFVEAPFQTMLNLKQEILSIQPE